jgi:serine phosphatase RsbU (regulator of sigma subunit)
MAIAGRPTGQAGSPGRAGRAGRSWAQHAAAAVVLVVGLGLTVTLSVVTASGHHRTNAKLLALETRLIRDEIAAADPLYVEDHLGGAASLAAATDGSTATFTHDLSGSVTAKGPFVTASLWRLGGSSPLQITHVGRGPLLAPAGAAMASLLRRAAASSTFVVTKVTAGRSARLGYATAAPGADATFVAYAEVPLPAGGLVSEPGSPVSDLNIAVYLGRSQARAALLEASSAAPLPLRGTTYTTRIPFGDTVLTLTTSARGSLTGSLGVILPWSIGVGGAALTILGALLAERLVRRRARAERMSTEIGRLYVEQRSVAQTLQQAILPDVMPAIPGMQIAVRYLPGVSGTDVGGDWYDVVPLGGGRFVFVVGDVSGRGVRAAATMASLQYASRAYALEGHPPAVILGQLTRTMDIAEDGQFATVLCGLVDVSTHEVALASAGHLPPLVCGGDGAERASLVPAKPGTPIGISGGTAVEPTLLTAAACGTIIAYTDGLVERRGETLDTGLDRLVRTATARCGSSLDDLLTSLISELTGDSPTDDIALIGLRWLN